MTANQVDDTHSPIAIAQYLATSSLRRADTFFGSCFTRLEFPRRVKQVYGTLRYFSLTEAGRAQHQQEFSRRVKEPKNASAPRRLRNI